MKFLDIMFGYTSISGDLEVSECKIWSMFDSLFLSQQLKSWCEVTIVLFMKP